MNNKVNLSFLIISITVIVLLVFFNGASSNESIATNIYNSYSGLTSEYQFSGFTIIESLLVCNSVVYPLEKEIGLLYELYIPIITRCHGFVEFCKICLKRIMISGIIMTLFLASPIIFFCLCNNVSTLNKVIESIIVVYLSIVQYGIMISIFNCLHFKLNVNYIIILAIIIFSPIINEKMITPLGLIILFPNTQMICFSFILCKLLLVICVTCLWFLLQIKYEHINFSNTV